jgi:hypothetical protein
LKTKREKMKKKMKKKNEKMREWQLDSGGGMPSGSGQLRVVPLERGDQGGSNGTG